MSVVAYGQAGSSILHFGLRAIEYWSVSLTKNLCMEAQAIITALSATGVKYVFKMTVTTYQYREKVGGKPTNTVSPVRIQVSTIVIWSIDEHLVRSARLQIASPLSKKAVTSHTSTDNYMSNENILGSTPLQCQDELVF